MLISKELETAINQQIGAEFAASLQYISIASYFDADDLPQLAAFFYRQADEEHMHAMKFQHFLVEAGGQVRIPAIAETKYDFNSAEECVQLALDWENEVTNLINNLMDIAVRDIVIQEREKDLARFQLWYKIILDMQTPVIPEKHFCLRRI